MNNDKKGQKEIIKNIILILVLLSVSVFLLLRTINRIKYFSYKEVEGILISHGEITDSGGSFDQSCIGAFEYDVNGQKYTISFSISHYYCQNGYKKTIYYDANNPQNSTGDRSIGMLMVVIFFDVFAIGGLFVVIKDLFKPSNSKEKNTTDNGKRIQKRKKINHSIYGNYEITYDSDDMKYGPTGIKRLELIFSGEKAENYSNGGLYIYFPEKIISDLFDIDKTNIVLNKYSKIDSNYIEKIIKEFINQEIDKLSNWYDVPNSLDGKKMLNDKRIIFIEGLEIDNNLNIIKLYFSYNYSDDNIATFLFNYDVNTRKIELDDISS